MKKDALEIGLSEMTSSESAEPSAPELVASDATAFDGEMLPGEAEYAKARSLPHHRIPTYRADGEYLTLLGKAAEAGCPRALAKLGEYAIRREMLVEAHYWFWRARKRGVRGLDVHLRKIRRTWQQYGSPSERSNRHPLFMDQSAENARAVLELLIGRNRAAAQAFLQEHAPDLLP